MRQPVLLLGPPLLFLAIFFVYPLGVSFVAAFQADGWQWLAQDYATNRLLGAVWQATLSTMLTLAIAMPLAWHHHAVKIPFGRVQLAIHAAPFVLPVFVVVGGMRELFGPTGWLSGIVGVDLISAAGPLAIVVLAHAYYNYGFAARIIHASLERRPWQLEEAAMTLGASHWQAKLRILVPLLAPGITSVALLVWLFSFTSFGVVLFLGGGVMSTPETLIYQNLAGAFPQKGRAAAIGALQLLVNIALLWGYFRLQRRTQQLPREATPGRRHATRTDILLLGGGLTMGLLPAISVLVGGFRVRGEWSLEAWRAILNPSHPGHLAGFELGQVLMRTAGYAVASGTVALGMALLLGYGLQRTGRLRPLAEGFAALPLATSSVLLGLGYVLAFGAGSWLDLRGQWVAIVIVHALVGFPFVARILLPALQQHDTRLDDAAALLGANSGQVKLRVHWPLLKGPSLAALGFAFAMSIGDFGASILLMQRDTMGLMVWIGEHDRPFDALLQSQSTALTGLLAILAAGAYLLVEWFRGPELT